MALFDEIHVKRHVLVVDDQAVNRKLLSLILKDDFDVMEAEDGQEAMEILRREYRIISAVLLDLNMPVMNGEEVIQAIKQDERLAHIPIIVLTVETGKELDTLRMGAASFISKPFEENEVIRYRVRSIVDLSEDRKIIQATERDELTGLYNQNYFFEYCEQLTLYHPDWKMDALVLDIDHFHLLNEMYGRQFGDQVLRKLGDMLQNFLRATEGLATRVNSDVFYIFARSRDDHEEILQDFQNRLNALRENTRIRLHLGVCRAAEERADLHQRFDRAQTACNLLRGSYNQMVGYYDRAAHERDIYFAGLVNDLPRALREKEFKVYYQPKYDVTGDRPVLKACEALVRWQHPEHGMVSPGDFIPLFERVGLIQQVDMYVWHETARQIKAWKDRYNLSIPVSVNLSRVDIHEGDLVGQLSRLIESYGLKSGDMHLEITESAYTQDEDELIAVITALRKLGFEIEMDDFGTGYSSLNMISTLPIDVLKMDMRFVKNLQDSQSKDYKLINIITDIARFLQVPAVAEGVETEKQVELLREAGIALIQGYFFSKPVPPDEFEKLIIRQMEQNREG